MRLGGSTFGSVAPGSSASMRESDRVIERYGVHSGPVHGDLQALTALAARIFNTPGAAINILTTTHRHQVATTGFEPTLTPRDESMCAAVAAVPEVVVVPDARLDPASRATPS